MKNLFPGYYRKSEDELNQMWENGLIVFDTNVLLNLYRYSDSTRETILNLIAKISNKIWLPHQAALEYNRNRCEVISDQEKAYREFLNKIHQIKEDLQSTNKPPFLTESVDKELNSSFDNVSNEVQESIKKYSNYLKDDPIYNKIAELFEDKIGKNYSEDILDSIYREGEERYKKKIPPGFEDEKNKDGAKKFGDLILWKQIIDKGKECNKPIILVTDERKKDWWWNIKDGRLMGPRQELIEEIKNLANIEFHMYSSERFLSYGQKFMSQQVDRKALDEIQAMVKAENDLEHIKETVQYQRGLERMRRSLRLKNQIEELREKATQISQKIDFINTNSDALIYVEGSKENYEEELRVILEELDFLSKVQNENKYFKYIESINNSHFIKKNSNRI